MNTPQPNLAEYKAELLALHAIANTEDQQALNEIIATIGDQVTYELQWRLLSNSCSPALRTEISILNNRHNIFTVFVVRPNSDLANFLANISNDANMKA